MGLIHYWTLDEASGAGAYLLDSVGTAHGTPTGTTSVLGLFDRARQFTGSTDRVKCGSPADLDFTTGNFTIRAVINKAAISTGNDRRIVAKDNLGSHRAYALSVEATTGKLKFQIWESPGSGYSVATTASVCDGLTHDIFAVRAANALYLYIDGALMASAEGTASALDTTTDELCLGAASGDSYQLEGWVDNVMVWDEALSATAISYYHLLPLNTLLTANRDPASGASDIPIAKSPYLSIKDLENSIVLAYVDLYIDGVLAYDGATDTFQTGFTGSDSKRTGDAHQYNFRVDPTADFATLDSIPVRVVAQNDLGHTLDETASFTTGLETGPEISAQDPAPDETGVTTVKSTQFALNPSALDPAPGDYVSRWTLDENAANKNVYDTGTFPSPDDLVLAVNNSSVLHSATRAEGTGSFNLALDKASRASGLPACRGVFYPVTNAWTMCAWVKIAVGAGSNEHVGAILALWEASPRGTYFGVYKPGSGHPRVYVRRETATPTALQQRAGSIFLDDAAWHHIAVIHEAAGGVSSLHLWVDGVEDTVYLLDQDATLGNIEAQSITLGNGYNNWYAWDYGLVDDVRIYNRALSRAELHQFVVGA